MVVTEALALEKLVSEITYTVLMGMIIPAHSLTQLVHPVKYTLSRI